MGSFGFKFVSPSSVYVFVKHSLAWLGDFEVIDLLAVLGGCSIYFPKIYLSVVFWMSEASSLLVPSWSSPPSANSDASFE